MVMADRTVEENRLGRRNLNSRSSSPNGHLSPGHLSEGESSATDDSEHDNGMRIGAEYQAEIPVHNTDVIKMENRAEAMLVWAPSPEVPEGKLLEYISMAKTKHGYNTEQALGMLFWHKHNIEKALTDLANFTPFPDEWTVEDKVLFEQAFSFHGKSFHRIRQMLPDKSIASLVKYYYSWKKTRSRTSLMDRQARKFANKFEEDSEGRSEGSGNDDSDFDNGNKENGKVEGEGTCSNCNTSVAQVVSTPKGSLCNICYQYWRRTGVMRSNIGPKRHDKHSAKHRRKPPRGMYMNMEDLKQLSSGPPGQGESILKSLEQELVSLKRQVQNNKQMLSLIKHKSVGGIADQQPPEMNSRINARWSNEELLLAVQGVRKYGKDFKAIAEVIGNKSETHVRSFFINYRRRYNLDEVVAEYEAEHPEDKQEDTDDKMETDDTPESSNSSQSATATSVPNGVPSSVVTNGVTSSSATPPVLQKLTQSPTRPAQSTPAVARPIQTAQPVSSHARLLPQTTPRSPLQQPPPLRPTPAALPTAHAQ
ncbi:unnamed protein product [Owenia fusiformis]|uniref:Uncharacterized protein n=1 Tax=Owenia fusiformis TaxID=6347 RepID=A0A8J1UJ59_OWEFU|nr:unnamed protein product [Owenia fusiformis]